MKIYTKTGDKGSTALFGGKRVPKYHERIDAYGTVDELNAHIGHLRDHVENEELRQDLLTIQNELFTVGSQLATPKGAKVEIPRIDPSSIDRLEAWIDSMNQELPELRSFIIPGGHPLVSLAHIARCVCRRAERNIVLVAENEEIDEPIIAYMNRLSDTLFVLARKLAKDNGASDLAWSPKS